MILRKQIAKRIPWRETFSSGSKKNFSFNIFFKILFKVGWREMGCRGRRHHCSSWKRDGKFIVTFLLGFLLGPIPLLFLDDSPQDSMRNLLSSFATAIPLPSALSQSQSQSLTSRPPSSQIFSRAGFQSFSQLRFLLYTFTQQHVWNLQLKSRKLLSQFSPWYCFDISASHPDWTRTSITGSRRPSTSR